MISNQQENGSVKVFGKLKTRKLSLRAKSKSKTYNQVLDVEVTCTWEHCAAVKICKWSRRKSPKVERRPSSCSTSVACSVASKSL